MAPINLPDGSEVSEIVLPDGSTASEVIAPDGSTVFGAIPDSVVDHFEESLYENQGNSLSDYYSGDTSYFERQTSVVFEGSYALRAGGSTSRQRIASTSGLNRYYGQGDGILRSRVRWDGNINGIGVQFGAQDANNCYNIEGRAGNGDIQIKLIENASSSILNEVNANIPTNEWAYFEIEWTTDDNITATLFDSGGSEVASVSTSDSTYAGNDGVGLTFNTGSTSDEGYIDLVEVI